MNDDRADQRDLFDAPPVGPAELYGGFPPHVGTKTSAAAAAEIIPLQCTLREKVYRFIAAMGHHGTTDEEMQDALAMNPNTQRPRRRELQLLWDVRDSGRTRETHSGRQAVVWTITGRREEASDERQ